MAKRTCAADAEVLNREEDTADSAHVNDNLDDVFGSAPDSPTFPAADGDLDDGDGRLGRSEEWSDIPRLKEKHETEGYRDGVTKGKAESVQKGFDEGYGLGATLGLRIGKILGVLEGIHAAIQNTVKDATSEETEWEEQKRRVQKLWVDANEELKTRNVFGKEWWGEDGIWRFAIPGEAEGKEVLFPDVAAAHPLVVKWERVVEEEVKTWGLNMELIDHESPESHENDVGKEEKKKEEPPVSKAPGAAKELAW